MLTWLLDHADPEPTTGCWLLSDEERKAKRNAYMRGYLPVWRAQRQAASSGSAGLLSKSARREIRRIDARLRGLVRRIDALGRT